MNVIRCVLSWIYAFTKAESNAKKCGVAPDAVRRLFLYTSMRPKGHAEKTCMTYHEKYELHREFFLKNRVSKAEVSRVYGE